MSARSTAGLAELDAVYNMKPRSFQTDDEHQCELLRVRTWARQRQLAHETKQHKAVVRELTQELLS